MGNNSQKTFYLELKGYGELEIEFDDIPYGTDTKDINLFAAIQRISKEVLEIWKEKAKDPAIKSINIPPGDEENKDYLTFKIEDNIEGVHFFHLSRELSNDATYIKYGINFESPKLDYILDVLVGVVSNKIKNLPLYKSRIKGEAPDKGMEDEDDGPLSPKGPRKPTPVLVGRE